METLELVLKIGRWAVDAAIAFAKGDDGPEPKRLAAILPDDLRADLEHARQRELMEAELRADIAKGPTRPSGR